MMQLYALHSAVIVLALFVFFLILYLEALLVETNNAVCYVLSIFRKFFPLLLPV